MSEIMPGSLYSGLDEWSRELLMTLSVDYKIGLATSIVVATVFIKSIFLYCFIDAGTLRCGARSRG